MQYYQKEIDLNKAAIMEALNDKPHLKVLVAGSIDQIVIYSTGELKHALSKLYHAVPSQSNDTDWWPDELTEAMGIAEKLI
jgi:hypothetical protein